MDLDAAADRLYGLPREQFVAERDKLARAQPALAKQIKALRKPTVAAWQANQLARKHRKQVAALVALGGDLRAAQEALDGTAMRTLSRQRTELLDKLVGAVPDAATGLRELLEGTLADPEAAAELTAGRLVSAPESGGWGFGFAAPAPQAERAPKNDTPKNDTPKNDDPRNDAAKRERERAQQALDDAADAEAEAHKAVDAAEAELRSRADRIEQLQAELADARRARDEADRAVKQARQEAQRRAKDVRAAERRLREV